MKKLRDQQNDLLEKKRKNNLKEETDVKTALLEKLQIFSKKEEVAANISKLHDKFSEVETNIKKSRDEMSTFLMKQESDFLSSAKAEMNEVLESKKKSENKLESDLDYSKKEIATCKDLTRKVFEASKVESERFIETFRHRKEELNSNFEHIKKERMLVSCQEQFKLEVLKRSAALLEITEQREKELNHEAQTQIKTSNEFKKLVSRSFNTSSFFHNFQFKIVLIR